MDDNGIKAINNVTLMVVVAINTKKKTHRNKIRQKHREKEYKCMMNAQYCRADNFKL